ncbi:Fur family transcriptional regulator [Jongsikchunia kroppenstedtii]|uniref:Fur family transcriptional regulator n=1 Tax=Jongsikchunia kroppenstedtii TaxID=1121721 RepID=UPI0009DB5813|nr:Fur family transcriptional regulator [Jongsikchunia kroppenstedtii]
MTRRGYTTKERAVLAVLDQDDRFRSAQQLRAEIQRQSTAIGLATIYRILHRFASSGIAEGQRSEQGEELFRRNDSTGHHHNLVCRQCGRAEPWASEEVEHLTENLARRHRYSQIRHCIDIYGVCPDCGAERSKEMRG